MAQDFALIVVGDLTGRDIGIVGFPGGDAVAIATFFDSRDADRDDKVGRGEWVVSKPSPPNLRNKAAAEVAMAGRHDPRIYDRDPGYRQMSAQIHTAFAAGLVMDGVWTACFRPGVKAPASGAAKGITGNMVKQVVIRKGFEKAARAAFESTCRG